MILHFLLVIRELVLYDNLARFQNRRAKWRKQERIVPGEPIPPQYSHGASCSVMQIPTHPPSSVSSTNTGSINGAVADATSSHGGLTLNNGMNVKARDQNAWPFMLPHTPSILHSPVFGYPWAAISPLYLAGQQINAGRALDFGAYLQLQLASGATQSNLGSLNPNTIGLATQNGGQMRFTSSKFF